MAVSKKSSEYLKQKNLEEERGRFSHLQKQENIRVEVKKILKFIFTCGS